MEYQNGSIYKIVCNLDSSIVYIGSTFKPLLIRFNRHKAQYRLYKRGLYGFYSLYEYFDKYGVNNFNIIKIKDYLVCDRCHLLMYEMLWINKSRREVKLLINKSLCFNIYINTSLLNVINYSNKNYVENQDKRKFQKCNKCNLYVSYNNLISHQKSNKCKKLEKINKLNNTF
jgi:hypothetical protein